MNHPAVSSLNNTYERALVNMHKMPRVWLDYLELLVGQRLVTRVRRTFDRALCSLPITQHDRIWPQYLVRRACRVLGVPGYGIGFWRIQGSASTGRASWLISARLAKDSSSESAELCLLPIRRQGRVKSIYPEQPTNSGTARVMPWCIDALLRDYV